MQKLLEKFIGSLLVGRRVGLLHLFSRPFIASTKIAILQLAKCPIEIIILQTITGKMMK